MNVRSDESCKQFPAKYARISLPPSITIPGSDGVKTGKMNIISVVLRARRMCIICRARLLLTSMYLLVLPSVDSYGVLWNEPLSQLECSTPTEFVNYQPFF